jgi:hypothetical protein
LNDVTEIDYRGAFVVPCHPCARKMFQTLKRSFGIHTVHKKTPTLGTCLFKSRSKADFWTRRMWCTLCPVMTVQVNTLVKQQEIMCATERARKLIQGCHVPSGTQLQL